MNTTTDNRPISPAFRAVAESALRNALRWQEVPSTALAYLEMAIAAHQEADGSALQGMTIERWTAAGEPLIFLRELYASRAGDTLPEGLVQEQEEADEGMEPPKGEHCYPSPVHWPVLAAHAFILGAMHGDRNGVAHPPEVKKLNGQWHALIGSNIVFTVPEGARKEVAQAFVDGAVTAI